MAEMYAKTMTITPDLAREWKKTSKGNSRFGGDEWKTSKAKVLKYARDIRNGDWQLNGEAIHFYEDGSLANGHHRIDAIIEAATPLRTLVVFNVPKNSNLFDAGWNRSTPQQLMLMGLDSSICKSECAAMAKLYFAYNSYYNHQEFKSRLLTTSEIEKFMRENEDKFRTVENILNGRQRPITRCAALGFAFLSALSCGVNRVILARFYDVMNSGIYEGQGELAAIMARNYAMDIKLRNKVIGGGSMSSIRDTCYYQTCLHDFVCNEPRKKPYKNPTAFYTDTWIKFGDAEELKNEGKENT